MQNQLKPAPINRQNTGRMSEYLKNESNIIFESSSRRRVSCLTFESMKLRDAPYIVPIHTYIIIGKHDSVARFWENIAFALAREDRVSGGFFCGSPKG